MFYDLFPKGIRKILYLLTQATIIAFFIALGYCGYIEICDEIALNTITETMEVPVWWFTSSIPLGSALIVLRTLQKSAEDLRNGTF
jgi:TRAP-type C4-dicarboxylate transport system permease small subunit